MPNLNYTAKGKQVFDEIGKPMTREAVDADIENWHSKIKKNEKTAQGSPDLKDVVDFANKGLQEDLDSARKARQAHLGGGRGEVNPDIDGKKKGGRVKLSASKRADGIATKGFTKGRYL